MRDRKPAAQTGSRRDRYRWGGVGSRRWTGCVPIVGLILGALLLAGGAAWAQPGSAVVVGADRVFVRRGPGTEFPPFATLTKGDAVEVQEVQGEWTRIMTAGGQTGFVRSSFLVPPGEAERPPVRTATAPAIRPPATAKPATVGEEPPELRAAVARNQTLEAEIRTLQQEIAELRSRSESTATPAVQGTESPPATVGPEQLHAEMARLAATIAALQQRLEGRSSSDAGPVVGPPLDGDAGWFSGALALGVVGLALGWLAGSAFGRKGDRGRRTRIRF